MNHESKTYSIRTSLQGEDGLQLPEAAYPRLSKHLAKRPRIRIHQLILVASLAQLIVGVVFIGALLFMPFKTQVIEMGASGTAIIFAGLLNLVALERGGSGFSKAVAAFVNGVASLLCGIAAVLTHGILFYLGGLLFLATTLSFLIDLKKRPL